MAGNKVIFVAFAIEDERQRGLLKGQSLHTACPFEYVDMSVKEPSDTGWKERVRTRIGRSDGVIALVSHGGAIRLSGEWLAPNVHADVANAALIPNTGLVELAARPDGQWRCLTWVDTPL